MQACYLVDILSSSVKAVFLLSLFKKYIVSSLYNVYKPILKHYLHCQVT